MDVVVPEWLVGEFEARSAGGRGAIVRRDFLGTFDQARLIEAAGPGPGLVPGPGPSGGRAPARVVPAGALGEAVVRRHRCSRGSRRIVPRARRAGHPAFEELFLTERLRRLGVPVAEVLAAVEARARRGGGSALITRRVVGSRLAPELLAGAGAGEAAALLEDMGRSVRLLHEAGGWHADLSAESFLIATGRVGIPPILIGFDRGRTFAPPTPRSRAREDLRRLRRSLSKLDLRQAARSWEAFERGYTRDPGPPSAA
ncbi:MAG: lipopolysaccharide kinase InaA family protein [Gemmatimonadota bacterium]